MYIIVKRTANTVCKTYFTGFNGLTPCFSPLRAKAKGLTWGSAVSAYKLISDKENISIEHV